MPDTVDQPLRTFLRVVGSLWFAAVLLLMTLVAMACATVFESMHSTERALAEFYGAWWFHGLLALLGVNVLAAMLARYPFNRRQIGFVLTHSSILVVLIGALITREFAENGSMGIAEGQSTNEFRLADVPTLHVSGPNGQVTTLELSDPVFRGFDAVPSPKVKSIAVGDLAITVQSYLPHSVMRTEMVNDNPRSSPALELALSHGHGEHVEWLFPNRKTRVGEMLVAYRVAKSEEDFTKFQQAEQPGSESVGLVKVSHAGRDYHLSLAECRKRPMPIGQTGLTAYVTRYFPHANVGTNNKIANASDRPINPAIEVQLRGPDIDEKRLAFARFPDFGAMHSEGDKADVKITFVAPSQDERLAPMEVIEGPTGNIVVRLDRPGNEPSVVPVKVGDAVEIPGTAYTVTIRRRLDHARTATTAQAAAIPKKGRVPAILLKLATGEYRQEMWVQKYAPSSFSVNGQPYRASFADKTVPLAFSVRLNRFRIGYYPGTRRPRSFESSVTITDPTTGRELNRVVSMNNPTSYGGYTLYQSSYDMTGQRPVSFLSVGKDPGIPVVFAGYALMIVGMLVVLVTRMAEKRGQKRVSLELFGASQCNGDVEGAVTGSGNGANQGMARRHGERSSTRPSDAGQPCPADLTSEREHRCGK